MTGEFQQKIAEAMLELRGNVDVSHPLCQGHLEDMREEFDLPAAEHSDQEVWDHMLDLNMFTHVGIKAQCINLCCFWSLVERALHLLQSQGLVMIGPAPNLYNTHVFACLSESLSFSAFP